MQILGAGLAGLLAGCHFPNATLYEAGTPEKIAHKAVLRFRTPAVGDSVGIDFRKVRVRKGIWYQNAFHEPTIRLANFYAEKVIGAIVDRSIWHIEPVDRYIAPENFQEQLIDRVGNRIHWNTPVDKETLLSFQGATVTTMPLSILAQWLTFPQKPEFSYAPIHVQRFRLPKADVFQTIYFPDPLTTLYRVSITGDLVIAEYVRAIDRTYDFWPAFGIDAGQAEPIEVSSQRFGKILPIDDTWRKAFIFFLSHEHGIYSIGRYSTWRNILLDDLIPDLTIIKRLIGGSAYARRLANL